MNRGTICVEVHPFRIQPFRGINCGLIPDYVRNCVNEAIGIPVTIFGSLEMDDRVH